MRGWVERSICASLWAEVTLGRRKLDASDVGGEEVDAVAVEVAAGAVVVLGAGVGVPGEDLRIPQGDSGAGGVGDGGVPQGLRADVPRDSGGRRDPDDHAVDGQPVRGRRRLEDYGAVNGPQVSATCLGSPRTQCRQSVRRKRSRCTS